MLDSLSSSAAYQAFIYELPSRYASIRRSTLVYIPSGMMFGRVEGLILFQQNIILCVQEYLNFELGVIEGYGYEVSRPHISPDALDFPSATPHRSPPHWLSSLSQRQPRADAAFHRTTIDDGRGGHVVQGQAQVAGHGALLGRLAARLLPSDQLP